VTADDSTIGEEEDGLLAVAVSVKQMKLFQIENPLSVRLGNEFFRAIPMSPGVYRFFAVDGKLLYIGQSGDLKARIGSYRHVAPERHPKRILRLVARVARIEWELCESAREAVQRESELLLEHRPPFNRAGVWRGLPWWLSITVDGRLIRFQLSHEETENSLGPLRTSFRYVLGPILRCALRVMNPTLGLVDFPCGLVRPVIPLDLQLWHDKSEWLEETVIKFISSDSYDLLELVGALPSSTSLTEQALWDQDLEVLERHQLLSIQRVVPARCAAP
jgi:hypothetical protein